MAFPETTRRTAKLAERDLLEAEVTEDGVVILGPVTTVDRSRRGSSGTSLGCLTLEQPG